jgi:hypothetical protein
MQFCKEAQMQRQRWPEQLRDDLRRQGLPALYIDRLVEELADHAADLCEEQNMEVREAYNQLGRTAELSAVARSEFDRWTFAGRHPILTFVLGPLIFAPAVFVACLLAAFLLAWVVGASLEILAPGFVSQLEHGSAAEVWCIRGFNLYARFLPFAIVAWLYCRLGQRRATLRWSYVACAVTGLIAALLFTKAAPSTAGEMGTYTVGLGPPPHPRQLLQVVPPLAIAAFFLLRGAAGAKRSQHAPVCG